MIKTKTARKLLLGLMALSLGLMLNLPSVQAAALTSQSISLTNSYPGATSSYTFNFTTSSTTIITEIDLTFSTAATGGTVPPTGTTTTTGSFAGGHIFAADDSSWTPTFTSNGNLVFKDAGFTPGGAVAGSLTVSTISNPSAGSCSGSYPSSPTYSTVEQGDTCFVQITTKTTGGGTIDTGAATFTLTPEIQATATVDPSLTFSVTGVNTSVSTGRSTSTNVSTTYSSLPFGHLSAGGSTAIGAQSLTVSTNANGGFIVTMAMTTQMSGSGTPGNKISPFITGGTPSTWSTPAAWVNPSGSNKIGTGTLDTLEASAIGAATTDTHVTGWSGTTNLWGPVPFAQTSAVNVMQNTSSINSDVQTVSYQVGVDAYQPADIYSGYVQYYAIPTY